MNKKFIKHLGLLSVVAMPSILLVSCGSTSQTSKSTRGTTIPIARQKLPTRNPLVNSWESPSYEAKSPYLAPSNPNDPIASLAPDQLLASLRFTGLNGQGTILNIGTVKASDIRIVASYVSYSNPQYSSLPPYSPTKPVSRLENGDVINIIVEDPRNTDDFLDLGDVTVTGLFTSAFPKEFSSWIDYEKVYPQMIEYANGVPVTLKNNAFENMKLKKGFIFPNSIANIGDSCFKGTTFDDWVTLSNTKIEEFPTNSFSGAKLGLGFELSDTTKYVRSEAFENAIFSGPFLLKGIGDNTSTNIFGFSTITPGFEIASTFVNFHPAAFASTVTFSTPTAHWVDANGNANKSNPRNGWYVAA